MLIIVINFFNFKLFFFYFVILIIFFYRMIIRLLLIINNYFFYLWCIFIYDFIIKRFYNGGKYLILFVIEVVFIGLIKCYLYVYIWSLKIICYYNIFKSLFIYFFYYIFLRNLLYLNFENDWIYCKFEIYMYIF